MPRVPPRSRPSGADFGVMGFVMREADDDSLLCRAKEPHHARGNMGEIFSRFGGLRCRREAR